MFTEATAAESLRTTNRTTEWLHLTHRNLQNCRSRENHKIGKHMKKVLASSKRDKTLAPSGLSRRPPNVSETKGVKDGVSMIVASVSG